VAALAQHNDNQIATMHAEEAAARARLEAMQLAAQRMGFELPSEEPWTGRRCGESWLHSRTKTYGRYVDAQTEEKEG